MLVHTQVHLHKQIYVYTQTLIHPQARVHTHACLYTGKYVYTHRCIYTHRDACTDTDACTHTRAHTFTDACTHTIVCLGFIPKWYQATANQGYNKQTQDNLPVLGVSGNLSIPLLGKKILEETDKGTGPYQCNDLPDGVRPFFPALKPPLTLWIEILILLYWLPGF